MKKSESTYGRIIFCKKLSISLLLTDRFTFMLPAGLTTEKYVLKHCNGLPLHGPTEIYFTYNLVDFSLKLITNMILAISQSCNQHKPFPTSVNNIDADENGELGVMRAVPDGASRGRGQLREKFRSPCSG